MALVIQPPDELRTFWKRWPGHAAVAKPPCSTAGCKAASAGWVRCACGWIASACNDHGRGRDLPKEWAAHRETHR